MLYPSPHDYIANLNQFAGQVVHLLDLLQIDCQCCQLDHIAIRLNHREAAQIHFEQWLTLGERISAAEVNGRPIWIVKLHQPLHIEGWSTAFIELPFPSNKTYPVEGWEHVEFIVPGRAQNLDTLCHDFLAAFPHATLDGMALAEKGVSVKLSQPEAEGEQLPNPTIAFKYKGICVKFHAYAIDEVVASEHH